MDETAVGDGDQFLIAGLTTRLVAVFASVFVVGFLSIRRLRLTKEPLPLPPPTPRLPLPPSLPSLPIVGSYPFMRCGRLFHRFFATKAKTLGPVFTCSMGPTQLLVLNDRQSIQEALIRKSIHFSDRIQQYTAKRYFNPNVKGILHREFTEDFPRYHQVLLSIFQEFGLGQVQMEQRIQREIEDLVRHIDSQNGRAFDPEEGVSLCTLNVIATILFGKRREQTDPALRDLKETISRRVHNIRFIVTFCPLLRFIPPFRGSIREGIVELREIFEFIDDGIDSSLREREEGSSSGESSFVSSFVEREGGVDGYDREDLRHLCLDLLEAGSDTTAMTILWSLTFLANSPDVQRRIHDELDAQLPATRLPSATDAAGLPLVEATILEVLRMSAVVPLALPHRVTADTSISGYHIPQGLMVYVNLHAVHMDEGVWGDPGVFRPDRFLDETGQKIVGRNRIIPFSIGRRACLGERIAREELFLLFTSLLQRFQILPPEGQTEVECREQTGVIVAPSAFKVRMIPRQGK